MQITVCTEQIDCGLELSKKVRILESEISAGQGSFTVIIQWKTPELAKWEPTMLQQVLKVSLEGKPYEITDIMFFSIDTGIRPCLEFILQDKAFALPSKLLNYLGVNSKNLENKRNALESNPVKILLYESAGSALVDMKVAGMFIADKFFDESSQKAMQDYISLTNNLDQLHDALEKVWQMSVAEGMMTGESDLIDFAKELNQLCASEANNKQFRYNQEKKAAGLKTMPSTQSAVMKLCEKMGVTKTYGEQIKSTMKVEKRNSKGFMSGLLGLF